MSETVSSFANLSQAELFALAMAAAKSNDDARPDASAQAHFLLGSQYAQIGMAAQGLDHMARALALAPDNEIVRFQLGLLQLSNALAQDAQATWEPLLTLGDTHPLSVYARGLGHLIRDEFAQARACLEQGLAMNAGAPGPTDGDMRKVLERIATLQAGPLSGGTEEGAQQGEEASTDHLFLNAYKGSKVH
jgi:tetratricopeptide (TPR) repeat protein